MYCAQLYRASQMLHILLLEGKTLHQQKFCYLKARPSIATCFIAAVWNEPTCSISSFGSSYSKTKMHNAVRTARGWRKPEHDQTLIPLLITSVTLGKVLCRSFTWISDFTSCPQSSEDIGKTHKTTEKWSLLFISESPQRHTRRSRDSYNSSPCCSRVVLSQSPRPNLQNSVIPSQPHPNCHP